VGGGGEEMHTEFWLRKLRERDKLDIVVLYEKIIVKSIIKKLDGVYSVDLSEDSDVWLLLGKSREGFPFS
jgi:hypothetical protein